MSLEDLSKKIGYEFEDIRLLDLALTHKSADNNSNNERLEFLGDAILSTVVSEYLYIKFPNQKEGLLTRMRSHLVKGDTLTRLAYKLELINFIKLSKGTANLSNERKQSILEGAVEAIIGAVMLDSNWETSKRFVLQLFQKQLSKISIDTEFRDSKTELQELLQSKKIDPPIYETIELDDGFKSSIKYEDKIFNAKGNSKRDAEREVAKKALKFIKI
tara:strand:- start:3766 stop:4416 length:651 start_codon:yes stop_codon:yes gene_type:complete